MPKHENGVQTVVESNGETMGLTPPENLTQLYIDRLHSQIGALTGQLVAKDLQLELMTQELQKRDEMLKQAASEPKGKAK